MKTLRQLREQAEKTQQQAATYIGVSKTALQKMEAKNDPGQHWPKLSAFYDYAEPYPAAPFRICDLCGSGKSIAQVIVGEGEEWLEHRKVCAEPECRVGWMNLRNHAISQGVPAPKSGTFGKVK